MPPVSLEAPALDEVATVADLVGVVAHSRRSRPACDSRSTFVSVPRTRPAPRLRVGRTLAGSRGGPLGGAQSGPCPVYRARPGSKHHILTDAPGIPLAASLTGGNRNDVTKMPPLPDRVPAVVGVVGRPGHRPDAFLADRGHDHDHDHDKYRGQGLGPPSRPR